MPPASIFIQQNSTMSHRDQSADVSTYHCICTTLILVTSYDLSLLPRRTESVDGALIVPLSVLEAHEAIVTTSALHSTTAEKKPIVVKREDGFEKRTLLKCKRCDLAFGYRLDEVHFDGSRTRANATIYVLPGSLLSTDEVKLGKTPEIPGWAQQV